MLQKMGWSAGQGLGRSGQGIVNPIEVRNSVNYVLNYCSVSLTYRVVEHYARRILPDDLL